MALVDCKPAEPGRTAQGSFLIACCQPPIQARYSGIGFSYYIGHAIFFGPPFDTEMETLCYDSNHSPCLCRGASDINPSQCTCIPEDIEYSFPDLGYFNAGGLWGISWPLAFQIIPYLSILNAGIGKAIYPYYATDSNSN
jgi:hypothetical protein